MNLRSYLTSLRAILQHPCNQGQFLRTCGRLLWWKINQLFFHLPVIVKLFPDVEIICAPSSSSGSLIVYTRLHEYQEMMFVHQMLQSRDTFVDIGANIGDYTCIGASKTTKGQVISCEANPALISDISQNVSLNQLQERVTVVAEAITNKVGKLSFNLEPASELGHLSYEGQSHAKQIEVRATTLENLAHDHHLDKIELLHIDVEGAEMSVLQGAEKLLKNKKIEVILFEVNETMQKYGYSPQDLEAYLQQHDFSLYTIFGDGKKLQPVVSISSEIQAHPNLVAVNNQSDVKDKLQKAGIVLER